MIGLFSLLFSDPRLFAVVAIGLILAITFHEFSHAFMADKLGDPTPRMMGRLTLDPTAHLDPWGALLMLFAGVGWGKPVQFDAYNLNNPQRDSFFIAIAGPLSNLLLAVILALVVHTLPISNYLQATLTLLMEINVGLAIFNLIPIPPLDGSRIITAILPYDKADAFERFMSRNSMLLILLLLFGGSTILGGIISPIIDAIMHLLLW